MLRPITTRFASRCAETGTRIPKGVNVIYDDNAKKVYAAHSKTAQRFYSEDKEARDTGALIDAQEQAYEDRIWDSIK